MVSNYNNGKLYGQVISFYPNGKLYSVCNYSESGKLSLIACHDSTGKVLADGGNGNWVQFNDGFDKIIEQGMINDSLQSGEWRGYFENNLGDTGRYVITYKKGISDSGIGYDAANKEYPFTNFDIQPVFGMKGTYIDFLEKNLHYPTIDAENKVQGKVIVQFIIEKDGTPTHFKVLRAPEETLANEAVRVLSLSVWKPRIYYGMPVRSYFTFPISFALNNVK